MPFEAAIAALTHRLAQRIETTPKHTGDRVLLRRLSYQYVNAYAAGLLVALSVSALAKLAHAVEYGQEFAISSSYLVPPFLYSVTFGGILPLVSLLFARILGDTTDAEGQPDPELTNADARAVAAEQPFAAAGDLFARLFAEEIRQRILAAAEKRPELLALSIAVIAGASRGYVSEVLKARDDR